MFFLYAKFSLYTLYFDFTFHICPSTNNGPKVVHYILWLHHTIFNCITNIQESHRSI
jgi:hypothetical protein